MNYDAYQITVTLTDLQLYLTFVLYIF